jgi:HTH-type transcriptional regulator/antitoxin HigA
MVGWSFLIKAYSRNSGRDVAPFYDDLDDEKPDDPREQEADRLAGEALIPEAEWKKSPGSRLRTAEAARHLANRLHIHPAIVAGRMRHFFKSYRVLNQLVGHKQVRICFPEIEWS